MLMRVAPRAERGDTHDMARTPREKFIRERDRCRNITDDDVADALGHQYADALDPEYNHSQVPQPTENGGVKRESKANGTATNHLYPLRCAHERGLDLLGADAETVNTFMRELVTEPEHRRTDLVDYDGFIQKGTGKNWQDALRGFYRFCTEPGVADDRPDVAVEWPANDIIRFTEKSTPKHDEGDMPEQADLDAMREACLAGQNTRRDRAFVELVAGTGQRVTALVTLRVGDVYLDGDTPHILLNPAIDGDGDKGAIQNTGRWKPIVTDTAPIRQWIKNHPLKDPEARAEYGAPDDFEECYLFVGSLRQNSTDASEHWGDEAARKMLDRRKADTATLSGVETVDIPVNPHNWRHYAYTKSLELPNIDESDRRDVFGWKPGSNTGATVYGHKSAEQSGRRFAEAFADQFGDADTESVAEQVVGAAVAGDLSPELRKALVRDLVSDDVAMAELRNALNEAAD